MLVVCNVVTRLWLHEMRKKKRVETESDSDDYSNLNAVGEPIDDDQPKAVSKAPRVEQQRHASLPAEQQRHAALPAELQSLVAFALTGDLEGTSSNNANNAGGLAPLYERCHDNRLVDAIIMSRSVILRCESRKHFEKKIAARISDNSNGPNSMPVKSEYRLNSEVDAACGGLERSYHMARQNGRLTAADASSLYGRFFDNGGHISSNVKKLYKQELRKMWDKTYGPHAGAVSDVA